MEDLKNKLLKLMWVPETKEIIWDMQTEKPVPADNGIYKEINSIFDLEKWSNEFKGIYSAWLEEDKEELYDITNVFYKKTLEHLEIVNKKTKKSFNFTYGLTLIELSMKVLYGKIVL